MGFGEKFRKFVGIDEDFDDDEIMDEDAGHTLVPKDPEILAAPAPAGGSSPSVSGASRPPVKTELKKDTGKYTNQFKMVVIEPESVSDCPRLVDSLKAKKPVIINLENVATETARQIFDFLSGATYALNGEAKKIANNIFVFAPENVDVSYNEGKKAQTAEAPVKSPWS